MQAYTYLLRHKTTGKVYYGCRKSETFDLWSKYFSSSKLIKRMIKEDGPQSFDTELRQTFDSYEAARIWETKLLQKVNAIHNPKFLNQAISSPRCCGKDSESELQRRKSISIHMKKRWKNPKFRSIFSTPEYGEKMRQRGKLRTHWPAPKYRGSPPTEYYRKITIQRNGKTKIIHQNQTSAYKKCGWSAHPDLNREHAPI